MVDGYAQGKRRPQHGIAVLIDRPGVFVNRSAVNTVLDFDVVKRIVFKDGSWLDVRYSGPDIDL
ncbi:hypothetical protein FAZ95_24980 [Trinickia violacea]|uniref:Uncharacterized protein n=1 Tax=Trinickia violacea TaxID=2571746 RepID=A0A4P8J240_9BURK|nr:hypothetical protein [Trinickia violacea]QCP52429.1 hypothetical protein FAZ95_24980 [Trinickia violacea]